MSGPAEAAAKLRAAAPRGLTDAAYDAIKREIIECRVAPGATVSQEALMDSLALTKAAVRGALARLDQEGLIQPLPRRGYRVAPISLHDIEEIFAVRELVEPAVTRLAAARMTAGALATLRRLAAISFRPGQRDTQRRYIQANRDFHLTIALCGGNGRLYRMLAQVLDEFARITFLTMGAVDESENWRLGHEAILDALARGDAVAAESSCRGELTAARGAMLSAVIASSGISRVNIARI